MVRGVTAISYTGLTNGSYTSDQGSLRRIRKPKVNQLTETNHTQNIVYFSSRDILTKQVDSVTNSIST